MCACILFCSRAILFVCAKRFSIFYLIAPLPNGVPYIIETKLTTSKFLLDFAKELVSHINTCIALKYVLLSLALIYTTEKSHTNNDPSGVTSHYRHNMYAI